MDVEAVVSIVIRKLTDLLIQESIIFNKAINEVELVRISLRQMLNFLIDAEDEKELDKCVKDVWMIFLLLFIKWRMSLKHFSCKECMKGEWASLGGTFWYPRI